jgi:hypothetical protein
VPFAPVCVVVNDRVVSGYVPISHNRRGHDRFVTSSCTVVNDVLSDVVIKRYRSARLCVERRM